MPLNDVLRGFKMTTISEGQAPSASNTVSGVRSGILPPISRDEPPDMNSSNSNNNNSDISVHVSSSPCF